MEGMEMDYEFLVRTGDKSRCSGTNANVHVQLFGQNGQTSAMDLDNDGINDLERHAYDRFTVPGIDVGDLSSIRVWHDNTGSHPGWWLESLCVWRPDGRIWQADCHTWLALTAGDRKIDKTFPLTEASSFPKHPGMAHADLWDSPKAYKFAADVTGGYCGPNVVCWIAAVWNDHVGRPYEIDRHLNQDLFPDGPMLWKEQTPGFQPSLEETLKRETAGELRLSDDTYYKYGTIHDKLKQHMPIIIRMSLGGEWHYVTLYKSRKVVRKDAYDQIRFYWQDNGATGKKDRGNRGLYTTGWRDVGENRFSWGAKRVVKA